MAQATRTELIGHLPLESPARASRRHIRWRKFVAVALGTLAILAASYLVVANVLLRTRLLRNMVSRNTAVLQLDYESAYSIFPGRVQGEGLSIRGRGRTVEWFLTLDRANTSISLLDPFHRSLHATRLRSAARSVVVLTPELRKDEARALAARCAIELRSCDRTSMEDLLRAAADAGERASLRGGTYAPLVVAAAKRCNDGTTLDPVVIGSLAEALRIGGESTLDNIPCVARVAAASDSDAARGKVIAVTGRALSIRREGRYSVGTLTTDAEPVYFVTPFATDRVPRPSHTFVACSCSGTRPPTSRKISRNRSCS